MAGDAGGFQGIRAPTGRLVPNGSGSVRLMDAPQSDWRESLAALQAQREQLLRKVQSDASAVEEHVRSIREAGPHNDPVVQDLLEIVAQQAQLNNSFQQEDLRLGLLVTELMTGLLAVAERVEALEAAE
jgi:hypothetical protein